MKQGDRANKEGPLQVLQLSETTQMRPTKGPQNQSWLFFSQFLSLVGEETRVQYRRQLMNCKEN